jgi:hypothetical protein
MTITWIIEQLSCYPEVDTCENVVFSAAWRANAVEGVHMATVYSSQALGPFGGAGTFIPFEDLTQEQVVTWVKDALGVDEVARYEAALAAQIAALVDPPVVTPALPWASIPELTTTNV